MSRGEAPGIQIGGGIAEFVEIVVAVEVVGQLELELECEFVEIAAVKVAVKVAEEMVAGTHHCRPWQHQFGPCPQ